VDRMDEPPTSGDEKNFISGGVITAVDDSNELNYALTVDLNQGERLIQADMYDAGTLTTEAGDYSIVIHEQHPNTVGSQGVTVRVTRDANPGAVDVLSIRDDDLTIQPEVPFFTGVVEAAFGDCYITLTPIPLGQSRFYVNIGDPTTGAPIASSVRDMSSWGSYLGEADDCWIVYVLGAFQGGWADDRDPDNEVHRLAATDDRFQCSAIYWEVIREREFAQGTIEKIIAHEIGHQVLEAGEGEGLMCGDLFGGSADFVPSDKHKIRRRMHSPGFPPPE
jgi:hypothetical protein